MKTSFFLRPTISALLVALWILTMVSMPISQWKWGSAAVLWTINAGVVIQAAAVFHLMAAKLGAWRTFRTFLVVVSLAWLVEFLGSRSGFPFGDYSYTGMLSPQLGHVPLLIPLAWFMMLPPAWAIARKIVPDREGAQNGRLGFRLVRASVAALAFTSWDLFLDPQMVAWGVWSWQHNGAYFGIPLTNYLGWFLVSLIFSFLFAPDDLPTKFLLIIYAITWGLQTIGQFAFWDLPGPAIVGFLGMGSMLAGALWTRQK